MRFVHGITELMASNPDQEKIETVLKFNPAHPISISDFLWIPPFLQIALFDLVLPLCNEQQRFREALDIILPCYASSQTLFDQLDVKFPHILGDSIDYNISHLPSSQNYFAKRFPKTDIIGLDYLLTCDSANPFDLKEFEAMNPDYARLILEYLLVNTMSLTELDMIDQMKEAGLLDVFDGSDLAMLINELISGRYQSLITAYYASN